MVWLYLFSGLGFRSELEDKITGLVDEDKKKRVVQDHVKAKKLVGDEVLKFFTDKYNFGTKQFIPRVPENLSLMHKLNPNISSTYKSVIEPHNLKDDEVLYGFEGLTHGFMTTYHKRNTTKDITSIAGEYIAKHPSSAFGIGRSVPYFIERLPIMDSYNLLDSFQGLDKEVLDGFLKNPQRVVDEVPSENLPEYLKRFNQAYTNPKLSEQDRLSLKSTHLDNLFEFKGEVIRKGADRKQPYKRIVEELAYA